MHIITNPASRRGRGERLTRVITGELNDKGIAYQLSYTSKPEDAKLIAKRAADSGEELVLCIGGDGTVSEVAAGLCGSGTILGIIPAGTGDDFARYLGIPKNPIDALNTAIYGKDKAIDLGFANDRAFINTAGSGFDVAVLNHTLYYKKIFHGLLAYVLGVLHTVFRGKFVDIVIECGGKTIKQSSLLVSVANGRFFGGGMCVAPLADASDGMFDILYVDKLSRFKIPFILAAFIKGKHIRWEIVHYFRAQELTITTSDASLQLDGEVSSEKQVHYRILPQAIKVRIPGIV